MKTIFIGVTLVGSTHASQVESEHDGLPNNDQDEYLQPLFTRQQSFGSSIWGDSPESDGPATARSSPFFSPFLEKMQRQHSLYDKYSLHSPPATARSKSESPKFIPAPVDRPKEPVKNRLSRQGKTMDYFAPEWNPNTPAWGSHMEIKIKSAREKLGKLEQEQQKHTFECTPSFVDRYNDVQRELFLFDFAKSQKLIIRDALTMLYNCVVIPLSGYSEPKLKLFKEKNPDFNDPEQYLWTSEWGRKWIKYELSDWDWLRIVWLHQNGWPQTKDRLVAHFPKRMLVILVKELRSKTNEEIETLKQDHANDRFDHSTTQGVNQCGLLWRRFMHKNGAWDKGDVKLSVEIWYEIFKEAIERVSQ